MKASNSILSLSLFMLAAAAVGAVVALSSCTPISHKESRFKYGDPYSPDPAEPRHEKYQ